MKTLKYLLLTAMCFAITSCLTEIDDYGMPEETLSGTAIDKFTGEPMSVEKGSMRIKLEELSWSDTPTPQYFDIKPDGTFFNSMIFKGHYRVTLENGPFVPIEPVELDIKGGVTHDFIVEPYLHLNITDVSLTADSMVVKFRISSPVDKYPVTDARVFINNTHFVGNGANIPDYSRKEISFSGMDNQTIYDTEHRISIVRPLSGRTFYVRAGARVNDPIVRKYNYSEIREIQIP